MLLCVVGVVLAVFGGCAYGQDGESEIAFSAGLTHHQVVRGGQKVVYDRVFTNVGSAYSTNTGVFTCPQSGLYVFQVHSLSRNDTDMWLELRHNYHYVMSIWAHTDNDYAAAGNSVIIQLTKGDEVSVVGVDGYMSELYGLSDEIYATFSGYLISPVFQEFPVVG